MIGKLAALEEARKASSQRRKEEIEAHQDPRESVSSFLAGFACQHEAIQQHIDSSSTAVAAEDKDRAMEQLAAAMTQVWRELLLFSIMIFHFARFPSRKKAPPT